MLNEVTRNLCRIFKNFIRGKNKQNFLLLSIEFQPCTAGWKELTYFSTELNPISRIGVSKKTAIYLFRTTVEAPRWQLGSSVTKKSKPGSTLVPMLRREEHNLRMDEIRQRMEQEQELFELRKEKLQLEVARERIQLEISRHQLSTLTSGDATVHEVVFSSKDIS